jgi:hypothetical protein
MAAMRLDSRGWHRPPGPLAAALAVALIVPAAAAAALRVDLDGGGRSDRITVEASRLVVSTGSRRVSLPVHGADGSQPRLDGALITSAGAGSFVDIDCGTARRSVVQISAEARGRVWREVRATFTLRRRAFVLSTIDRRTVTAEQASHRRCALVRQ